MNLDSLIPALTGYLISWFVMVIVWFAATLGMLTVFSIPQNANDITNMVQAVNLGIMVTFATYGLALLTARLVVKRVHKLSGNYRIVAFLAAITLNVILMKSLTAFPLVIY